MRQERFVEQMFPISFDNQSVNRNYPKSKDSKNTKQSGNCI